MCCYFLLVCTGLMLSCTSGLQLAVLYQMLKVVWGVSQTLLYTDVFLSHCTLWAEFLLL
jgi:hypothetical protein